MWLSAAKIVVMGLLSLSQGSLSSKDRSLWSSIQPSVITLYDHDSPTGCAALVERSGLFLAHRTALASNDLDGVTSKGSRFHLSLIASDPPTQLVLLKAESWDPTGSRVVQLAAKNPKPKDKLLAILPSGPIRAEFITGTMGVIDDSTKRMVPLNEIRFEAPTEMVGGAMVFTKHGELIGVLNATLPTSVEDANVSKATFGGAMGGNSFAARGGVAVAEKYGPGKLTVAYTIARSLLNTVVVGFQGPSHEVLHPVIGVFCVDAPTTGALVDSVRAGSTADKAGMKQGDIILDIEGHKIVNNVAFGYVMLHQTIGSKIKVLVRRDGREFTLTVEVAGRVFTGQRSHGGAISKS